MKSIRKFTVLALALCMIFAFSASAFASSYNVTFYKTNGTSISMADDIIAGDATVTVTGSITNISIPIKPIYNYAPMGMAFLGRADGYLRSVKVGGTTFNVNGSGLYTNATLDISVPSSLINNGRITATDSYIELYRAGTGNPYWMNHITPSFIIDFSAAL